MATRSRSTQRVRFGEFELDLSTRELWINGTKQTLAPQPFQVLQLLIERRGQLVTRDDLVRHLWTSDTFVDYEQGLRKAINRLREALNDSTEQPRFIETLPRSGYRFIAETEFDPGRAAEAVALTPHLVTEEEKRVHRKGRWRTIASRLSMALLLIACGVGIVAVGLYYRSRQSRQLTEKDNVVLADFDNKTGDGVFDETLRQALAVELSQSPFLNVISDRRVHSTLQMMGRPTNERMTAEVAREVCVRTGSTARLAGLISSLGSHYIIELDAVACSTGDTLARDQAEANSKEDVLRALTRASSSLRTKLGESLSSVQKYDAPIEASTSSLEALRSFSMGRKVRQEKGDLQSIPFIERAIELDPNFALAYAELALVHGNNGEGSLAVDYATKAYQLRDRVSEREKFRVSSVYFDANEDLDKEMQTYELWIATYPRDPIPHGNLGGLAVELGEYEKGLAEDLEAFRLSPDLVTYANLGRAYILLNRLDDAQAILDEAWARNLRGGPLPRVLYSLYFMRGDTAQMEKLLAWGAGKHGIEGDLLLEQSRTEAYYGRLKKARDSFRAKESTVAKSSPQFALFEAELGNTPAARQEVNAAMAASKGPDVRVALTLARIGDTARAQAMVEELEKRNPSGTILKIFWLPIIRAAIELSKGNSSQAMKFLEPASRYEMGSETHYYPAYIRGQAYLLSNNGSAAAAEFQKLVDHPGIMRNFLIGALARLQLARAYVMQGDNRKAKSAYENFLTLWKDADPDIPIYQQAKAEYAKLQ